MAEPTHSINATGLADILERVLDKGIVIAGDIKNTDCRYRPDNH